MIAAALIMLQAQIGSVDDRAAWATALADAQRLPPEIAAASRWVHIVGGDLDEARLTTLAWNYVSSASVIVRPVEVRGEGGTLLLRFDLRKTAPRERDLARHLGAWEKFEFDPRYSRILSRDVLASVKVEQARLHHVSPYTHGGQTYTMRWESRVVSSVNEAAIRIIGRHLDEDVVARLACLTGSNAPVVSHRYFVFRTLSQIQDKGLKKLVYGGLYYELVGMKKEKKKGQTDLDAIFEDLGMSDAGNAKKVLDRVRADKRVAVFRSGVTGKPRRVDVFTAPSGRVSITYDLRDESIDVGVHPVFNLIDIKPDGSELIFQLPNGLDAFAALDGAGNLVDEVPFDIASDSTIPSPHSKRLQPAISCIVCHGPNDGWMPLANDVHLLVSNPDKGLDIFGDLADEKRLVTDVIDRLAGLYSGSPARMLETWRTDYADAVLRATGPMASSKRNGDSVQVGSKGLQRLWQGYWYDLVTPQVALAELGIKAGGASAKESGKILQEAMPLILDQVGGIVPEDPRARVLQRGGGINRAEWDLFFDFAATRVKLKGKR